MPTSREGEQPSDALKKSDALERPEAAETEFAGFVHGIEEEVDRDLESIARRTEEFAAGRGPESEERQIAERVSGEAKQTVGGFRERIRGIFTGFREGRAETKATRRLASQLDQIRQRANKLAEGVEGGGLSAAERQRLLADFAETRREYQLAKKSDPEKWRRIQWAMDRTADSILSGALDSRDTAMALAAWPAYSKEHWGAEGAARRVIDGVSKEVEGDPERIRERLAAAPDLHLKYLLDNEAGNPGQIMVAVESLVGKPDGNWILKEVSVDRHLGRRSLTEGARRALFEAYVGTKNFASVNGALDVFQDDVRASSGEVRTKLFAELSGHNFWQFLSYIKLTPEEYRACAEKASEAESLADPEKRSEMLAYLKEQRPLVLLTNGEVMGFDVPASEVVAGSVEQITNSYSQVDFFTHRVRLFQQILSRGPEYPDADFGATMEALDSFLANNVHVSPRTFVDGLAILRDSEVISAEGFAGHLSRYMESGPTANLVNLLEFRSDVITPELRESIEDSVARRVEGYDLRDLVGAIAARRLPFGRERFDALLERFLDEPHVNTPNRFSSYFIQGRFLEDAAYAPRFMARLQGFEVPGFLDMLESARDRGELDASRYESFVRMCAESVNASALSELRNHAAIRNSPELAHTVLERTIDGASFETVRTMLFKRDTEPLPPDLLVRARDRFMATVPMEQVSSYYDALVPYFLTENTLEIIDLFAEQDNYAAVAGMVIFDSWRNFVYLKDDERRAALGKIWESGDAKAIAMIVEIATTDQSGGERFPYIPMSSEDVRRGVEILAGKDSPGALVSVLENAERLRLTPEDVRGMAEKIIAGDDSRAKDGLFAMYVRGRNLPFVDAFGLEQYGSEVRLDADLGEALLRAVAREGAPGNLMQLLENERRFDLPAGVASAAFESLLARGRSDDLLRLLNLAREEGIIADPARREAIVEALSGREDCPTDLYTDYVRNQKYGGAARFNMTQAQFDRLARRVAEDRPQQEAIRLLQAEQERRLQGGEQTVRLNPEIELALAKNIVRQSSELSFLYGYDQKVFEAAVTEVLSQGNPEILLIALFRSRLDLELQPDTLAAVSGRTAEIFLHGRPEETIRLFDAMSHAGPERVSKIMDITLIKSAVLEGCRKRAIRSQTLEMLSRFAGLGILNAVEAQEAYDLIAEDPRERQQQLSAAKMFGGLLRGENFAVIDEMAGAEAGAGEKFRSFMEKHGVSGKGRTLLTLIAAREYEAGMPVKDLMNRVAFRLEAYSRILDRMDAANLPDGLKVSIGIEYEMTHSLRPAYELATNGGDLKSDILDLSAAANIGQGNDSLHELAPRPADNPYSLLLELHLLQEMGFMNLNFDREEYAHAGHGYHLTLGGETGLQVSKNTNFLQNALIMAGWGGVNTGREVTTAAFSSSIRDKFNNKNVKVFENIRPAVELRSLSIDRWEQFERSVTVSFYAAAAIQAVEKYTSLTTDTLQKLGPEMPRSSAAMAYFLQEKGLLKAEVPDEKTGALIYEWIRFQSGMLEAVEDHNANFYLNETAGYVDDRGEWIDVSDFRGDDNKNRFESVVRGLGKEVSAEEYAGRLRFDPASLFQNLDRDFINTCVGINNLYLKPSKESAGDRVNAGAMLDVTKVGRRVEESKWNASNSIFEAGGQPREGYYAIQGGSDRMIVHTAQARLLEFRNRVEALLATP